MSKSNIEREIRHELRCLRRTADASVELLKSAGANPLPWHAAAAAKYAADVFMGLENLWKRRCRHLGRNADTSRLDIRQINPVTNE